MADWEQQYKDGSAARYWPNEELARFLGRNYGQPVGDHKIFEHGIALDIGCGVGGNMLPLIWCGFKVTGMDMSDEALKAARYWLDNNDFLYDSQYRLIQHRLPERFRIRDEGIDLVIDIQCIQHLNYDAHVAVYQEIYRILRPGGRFFSVHFDTGDQDKIFPQHPELNAVDLKCVQLALRSTQLNVVSVNGFSRSYCSLDAVAHWAVIEVVKS